MNRCAVVAQALRHAKTDPEMAKEWLERPITQLAKLGIKVHGVNDAAAAKEVAHLRISQQLRAVHKNGIEAAAGDGNDGACEWFVTAVVGGLIAAGTITIGGAVLVTEPWVIALAASIEMPAGAIAFAWNAGLTATGGATAVGLAQALCGS